MQAVEVGDAVLVVEAEDGDQPNHTTSEPETMQRRVDALLVTNQSVRELLPHLHLHGAQTLLV